MVYTITPLLVGDSCEVDIDECESNSCVNGACVDEVDDFSCTCNSGWIGDDCDVRHNAL